MCKVVSGGKSVGTKQEIRKEVSDIIKKTIRYSTSQKRRWRTAAKLLEQLDGRGTPIRLHIRNMVYVDLESGRLVNRQGETARQWDVWNLAYQIDLLDAQSMITRIRSLIKHPDWSRSGMGYVTADEKK